MRIEVGGLCAQYAAARAHASRDQARVGQVRDPYDDIEALVDQAIANTPAEVEAVKAGNEKLLNFLTGQVMKLAATKPNPKQVTELLRARLL